MRLDRIERPNDVAVGILELDLVVALAAGTPMLLMGDEVRRTQRGNNNTYCLSGMATSTGL